MSNVGRTKDAGWEVGVRTTVAAPLDDVWSFLVGHGLPVWLGEIETLPHEAGSAYATADGVAGTIRSYHENLRIRLTWQPNDWPHDSTVQVTVRQSATGTTIAVHHDRLADREERRLMLGHWKNVVAAFDSHFA